MIRSIVVVFTFISCTQFASGQISRDDLIGAWRNSSAELEESKLNIVTIIADGYFSRTTYSIHDKTFVGTRGGSWSLEANQLIQKIEFDSTDPESIGETVTYELDMSDEFIKVSSIDEKWVRIDKGTPGALKGAWLITARERDGVMKQRTPGPRKTMKILSGTMFQWIAYNVETKQFMGTGGGAYTTDNGKYTEFIEFFSRDASRVGAELVFDYELIDGDWHHKGKSSKGKPIYEVWSLRE